MMQVISQQHWIKTPRGQIFAQSWQPNTVNNATSIILLHNSLGCVALWRDFPERLAQASQRRVIAYDRLGFGQSDAHPNTLEMSFIRDEADGDFLAVYQQLQLSKFVLLGRSVGGGMAVGCATAFPDDCVALITESAQAFVDEKVLQGIREAKENFSHPSQLEKLKRYHGEKAQWVLDAWTETWLSDSFNEWNLESELARITCPVLCLQGDNDEYCCIEHPQQIAKGVAGSANIKIIANCGHDPHREQPDAVITEITDFLLCLK